MTAAATSAATRTARRALEKLGQTVSKRAQSTTVPGTTAEQRFLDAAEHITGDIGLKARFNKNNAGRSLEGLKAKLERQAEEIHSTYKGEKAKLWKDTYVQAALRARRARSTFRGDMAQQLWKDTHSTFRGDRAQQLWKDTHSTFRGDRAQQQFDQMVNTFRHDRMPNRGGGAMLRRMGQEVVPDSNTILARVQAGAPMIEAGAPLRNIFTGPVPQQMRTIVQEAVMNAYKLGKYTKADVADAAKVLERKAATAVQQVAPKVEANALERSKQLLDKAAKQLLDADKLVGTGGAVAGVGVVGVQQPQDLSKMEALE